MSTPPLMSQLESFLSVTGKRQTVIASNMANVDTPGFHTQDLDFARELNNAMKSSGNSAMANTGTGQPHVAVHSVKGLLERPDGNNVDLDRESLLLSESQLQYQLGTQLLKSRFHQLLSAIKGDQ